MPTEEHLPSNVIRFPADRRASSQPALTGIGSDQVRHEREVTVLVAEIRDWPTVRERIGDAQARVTLSKAIDGALAAFGEQGADGITLDGDPSQPNISCEFDGDDGPIRALRAAVAARRAVADSQAPSPPESQFRLGVGLDTGEMMHVRADDQLSYQAVGAMRMVAARLRDFAGPGQVFLTREVYEAAGGLAQVQPLGEVRINIHGETKEAFSLTALMD
jgi:class 3 adenylate cyclase